MEDLKYTIAKNITELRRKQGMTQADLARTLNYSDKAVSKWERRESMPDITVLKSIADHFGVTVDYLLQPEHHEEEERLRKKQITDIRLRRNHSIITCMGITVVWLLALIAFVIIKTIAPKTWLSLLPFLFALPITFIVWLVFNSIWFSRRRNFMIISLMMWSFLATVYFILLGCGINVLLIFALGFPGQAIILLWSNIRISRKKKNKH